MSHYPVAVFMSDDKQHLINLTKLLSPYDKETEVDDDGFPTLNPNATLDWYEIGGHWQGKLILKDQKQVFAEFPVPEKECPKVTMAHSLAILISRQCDSGI